MGLGGATQLDSAVAQDPAGEVHGGGIAAAEDRAHPAARRSARGSTIGQDMHPPQGTPAIEQRGPLADRRLMGRRTAGACLTPYLPRTREVDHRRAHHAEGMVGSLAVLGNP
jgi:hypothetical protein